MELIYNDNDGDPIAVARHGNETPLVFRMTWVKRTNQASEGKMIDIFREINTYWSSIPRQTQAEIYDLYLQIYQEFRASVDNPEASITRKLQPLVAALMDHHPQDVMIEFCKSGKAVRLPTDIPTELDPNSNHTADQTYLRQDYRELIALALTIRAAAPIFGELMSLIRAEAVPRPGKELQAMWKENQTMAVLASSGVFKCDAMERLRTYVCGSIPVGTESASAVLSGISTEDYAEWMVAILVIRRLTIGDISGADRGASLVRYLHSHITSRLRNPGSRDGNFAGEVIERRTVKDVGGQDKSSMIESLRARDNVPMSVPISMEKYILRDETGFKMARKICPDIPKDLVLESRASIEKIEKESVIEAQQLIAAMVCREAVSATGVAWYIDKRPSFTAIAVARACLWWRGHYELAVLVGSTPVGEPKIMSRNRLTAALLDDIFKWYPYVGREARNDRSQHDVVKQIERLNSGLSEFQWDINIPTKWLTTPYRPAPRILTGPHVDLLSRMLDVPEDIKIKLGLLAVDLASRNFNKVF